MDISIQFIQAARPIFSLKSPHLHILDDNEGFPCARGQNYNHVFPVFRVLEQLFLIGTESDLARSIVRDVGEADVGERSGDVSDPGVLLASVHHQAVRYYMTVVFCGGRADLGDHRAALVSVRPVRHCRRCCKIYISSKNSWGAAGRQTETDRHRDRKQTN